MAGRRLTTEDLGEWRACYERIDEAGPYHSPGYLDLLAGNFEHSREEAEAYVLEDGDDLVYYPYLRRPLSTVEFDSDVDLESYSDVVSSWYYGGPLTTDPALADPFASAFSEYCREAGIVAEFIRFDPNRRNDRAFGCLDPEFNRETVPVDLTGTAEDIWEGYEGRNQRAIKQARETDIVVEPTRAGGDVAAFHDIYTNAMEARDAAPHYRFDRGYFEDLLAREDLASLLVARHEGEVIGGFVAVHDDRIAHHFLSASNPDYWDMRVNNLMYHEVVMYMHETGRDVFDFQGGRPGVFKFKKGFSPDRGEFYVGKRTHLPGVYDRLVEDAAAAGIDTDTGYFPAYRFEQSN